MKYNFDEIISTFIVPVSELGDRVTDSTYFLMKNGCLNFVQGYYHPNGMLSGKILYYPKKGGWVDIFGREYECIHKSFSNGRMYSFTNPEQIEKHYKLFPEITCNARVAPVIKNNLLFPREDFLGFFDPKKSLKLCMEIYPKVRRGVEAASELLEFPLEQMGLTGSLQYGRLEEHDDDTDIVFYGTVEENYALMQRILGHVRENPTCHVYEFGKYWPLRLYHGDILVCPFFVYALEEEIPIHDCRIRSLKEGAQLTGKISDIRHSIYMPLVFPLEEVELDGEPRERFILILSDSYVRGEFEVGRRVHATGELVEIEKETGSYQALIVANNWDVKKVESR